MDQLERKSGSIVRIKLHNFMTFSSCEFRPGPRMNMILGPNGSGKSSLVCAICLGLGGTPKNLGRADELQKFVKNGCTKAKVEIELFDPKAKQNLIVQRLFTSTSNTSEWLLGDKPASQKQVLERLCDLNIQVDNLCQFLPQDKVQEFSQYTDKELLAETIRVVLGDHYLDRQKKLAARQKSASQATERLAGQKKQLAELEEDNKRNQSTVQRQKERAKFLEQIQYMEMKLPWLQFEAFRVKAKEAKEEWQRKEEEMKAGSQTLIPLKQQVDMLTKQYERAKQEFDQCLQDQRKYTGDLDKTHNSVTTQIDKITDAQVSIDGLDSKREKTQKKCEQQRKRITELEVKVQERKGAEHFNALIASAKDEIRPLVDEQARATSQVSSISASIARKSNELNRGILPRMRNLDLVINHDSSAALQRKREEQERLSLDLIRNKLPLPPNQKDNLIRVRSSAPGTYRSEVLGPLICELRAVNEPASVAMELFIPKNQWKFLISTDEGDQRALNRDSLSNILLVPGMENSEGGNRRPETYTPQLFQDTGILGYLDQLIVANPTVLEGARRLLKLHNCIVGTAKTDEVYAKQPDLFRRLVPTSSFTDKITIFTPTSRIDITRSQYGDRRETIKRSGLYNKQMNLPLARGGGGTNEESAQQREEKERAKLERAELVQQKQEIETELGELKLLKEEFDSQAKDLDKQVKEKRLDIHKLTKAKEEESKLEAKLEKERDTLEDLEAELNQDWQALAKEFRDQQQACKDRIEKHLSSLTFCKLGDVMTKLSQCNLAKAQYAAEKDLFTELHREENQRVSQMASKVEEFRRRRDELLNQAKKTKLIATAKCPHPQDYKEKFAELKDTVDELETDLENAKYQVQHIYEDTDALKKYEENEQRIQQLSKEILSLEMNVESETELLALDVKNWIDPVKNAVEEINTKFGQLFVKVAEGGYFCKAQVELKHVEENGLMDCGAEVFVTFREDQPLQRLTPKVQSGGERSLSTFMYMLSLQSKSNVPFRVVDEINQGIDPSKERLAFNILAEVTSEHPAQYFIATPKLLPGLAFPQDATILFVFNGPEGLQQKEWDATPFMKRTMEKLGGGARKRLQLEQEEEEEQQPTKPRRKRAAVVEEEN